jgi:predicted aldo/keto reductase-like oxidoreductase
MLTRRNDKNGDELSILGFGCMRFPMKGNRIDEDKAIAMIRDAILNGVNYFDTAYPYHAGKSETVLGKALDGGYREKVKIATKLPHYMISSLDGAKKIFQNQLTKLRVDTIDYYLLHMLSDKAGYDRMVKIGVLDWLEQLKTQGVIKNLGFSFHGEKSDFTQLVTAYPWDFCQIQYNYLDENNQAGKSGLELAHSLGMPVIVMEPLRGGKLAHSLPGDVLDEFKSYDQERSPVEWALRWIWNHPEVTLLLSGMSTQAQLEENIRIASSAHAGALSAEELAIFDRVKAVILKKTKVPCTGCGYCMPCPSGVNIPGCFSVYNDKYLLGKKGSRMKYFQNLGLGAKNPNFASLCSECGKCERHCPQHILIRDELKSVKSELEGVLFKPLISVARRVMKVNR